MKPACSSFKLQAQPYVPGRVRGVIRQGKQAATRDGLVVLSPDELTDFNGPCAGLIIINGQPFAHKMIRLMGFAIPIVLINEQEAGKLQDDIELILDGEMGLLFSPDLSADIPPNKPADLTKLFGAQRTQDDQSIMIRASVSSRSAMARALSFGASTIGSLRTEYLAFNSKQPPGPEFYRNELAMCGDAAEPLPLIVRLPDISAEKQPAWCASISNEIGQRRGMQLYDQEPIRSAISALVQSAVQVSEYYDIRLLVPYVTQANTFQDWRQQLGDNINAHLSIGAMIETPDAARNISDFLEAADFLALGTNDLLAHICGNPDRETSNQQIDPYHPAFYHLLHDIAQQAGYRTKEIQVDGLLSHTPGVLPALIGLGYRIFSIDPAFIPKTVELISTIDTTQAAELAQAVLKAPDSAAVKKLLTKN